MAKVQLGNVQVLDNPANFLTPFNFQVTFECIEELKEDLEWKMIYVGCAESEEFDQILDTIYVGPIPEGRHMFVFAADPPDVTKIPVEDALGVTVVLLTCSYRSQEFVRVGYFINNEYSDPELRENPPPTPQFDKVVRNILATEPRVTRFKINWDDSEPGSSQVSTKEEGEEAVEGGGGSSSEPAGAPDQEHGKEESDEEAVASVASAPAPSSSSSDENSMDVCEPHPAPPAHPQTYKPREETSC